MKQRLVIAVTGMLVLSAGDVTADIWSDPHPFRREALIDGRDFEYDSRSFLNRLSYQPLFAVPPDRDGIFGSAGSVTSTELYLDVAVQQTLRFDDERHAVRLNYRRSEDYDGYFDQQRIGYGVDVSDFRFGVSGDVRGAKAETDVYFEADWVPSEATLWRINLILPDAYLNQKGEDEAEYLSSARSWFVEWRQQWQGWQWRVAVNATPTIRLLDNLVDQAARAEQHRGMFELSVGDKWRWQRRSAVEDPDRNGGHDRFQGKLSLPFSYLAKAETGAYLSLSPSFYLHRAAFGGGNLQLHWPF